MNNIIPTTTESKKLSPQLLKKRKMILVFPLLALPFITMAFWALGGGKRAISAKEETVSGLNLQLPNAYLKDDKGETKLSFYELADQDSIKLGAQRKADPFFESSSGNDSMILHYKPSASFINDPTPPIGGTYKDPNEERVYQKLHELQRSLATHTTSNEKVNSNEEKANSLSNHSPETDGLETAFQRIGNNKESGDTELRQLNQMMDKILAIQHPESIKEPVKEALAIRKQRLSSKVVTLNDLSISLLGSNLNNNPSTSDTITGFFSLDEPAVEPANEKAIPAVIPETQTLINGAVVKLSLLEAIAIQGQVIPKGTFVYGIATLNNERLAIAIHSIHLGDVLYPVSLTVYDLDGLPGIYVPGTPTGEVVKGVTDRAFQSLELPTLNPSVGAQAASAGIQAAKSLLNKKASKVKVTLKAGYQVLLREQQP